MSSEGLPHYAFPKGLIRCAMHSMDMVITNSISSNKKYRWIGSRGLELSLFLHKKILDSSKFSIDLRAIG